MSFGLLTLGTQSLQANQAALSVTGQNISNVNTEGYSRQRPVLQSRLDLGGVSVGDIDRVADSFLNRQIWADGASYNSYNAFEDFANELDNLMSSDVTSISKAMDDYFGALQTAVDDPVSLPNRELFIAQSEALVQRFNDLDGSLQRQNSYINERLSSEASIINTISSQIAQLNDGIRIVEASGNTPNELLDQRDAKLSELSEHIGFTTIQQGESNEISIFVGNGQPLVTGQTSYDLTMIPGPADSEQMHIGLVIGGKAIDITDQASGGKIGGMLDYRDNVLDKSRDELGRIALVFADSMNEQHQKGVDLDGLAGANLFADVNSYSAIRSRLLSHGDNAVDATGWVKIETSKDLQASDYDLTFSNDDTFILTRQSDGARISLDLAADKDSVTSGSYFIDTSEDTLTLRVDGFLLNLESEGNFVTGDSFIIRPVRNAADEIDSVLQNSRQLALAAPLVATDMVDNTGTGEISVSLTGRDEYDELLNGGSIPGENSLLPPLNVSFLSPLEFISATGNTNTRVPSNLQVTDESVLSGITFPVTITEDGSGGFDVVDSTSPTAISRTGLSLADLTTEYGFTLDISGAETGSGDVFTIQHDTSSDVGFYQITDVNNKRLVGNYVSNESIQLQGYDVIINNQPDLMDQFSIDLNIGGVSDNRNSLLMSELQFSNLIDGASYQDQYGQTVELVGTKTAVAQFNAQASKSVLDNNLAMKASISGVSLDEEAAKLVQFQQAYQASAQLIRASQTIFDSLLQSV